MHSFVGVSLALITGVLGSQANVAAQVEAPAARAGRLSAVNAAASATSLASEQYQASAVAAAAAQTPKATFSEKLFDSNAFTGEVGQQQRNNVAAASATDQSVIDKIRSKLPRMKDLGSQLKYGKHVTVSASGDEAIDLARKAAAASPVAREPLLFRLQALAQNNVPEALNIYGFLLETGSLGAKRDPSMALRYYQAAAAYGYQPAIYNIALQSAYGRIQKPNLDTALALLEKANAIGPEDSYRICGMASFIAFRQGQKKVATNYATGCPSALTNLSRSTDETSRETLHHRIDLLRDFLATGADDAFPILVTITKQHAQNDPEQLYCKYTLINQYRDKTDFKAVKDFASHCVKNPNPLSGTAAVINDVAHAQLVAGVTGFVPAEIAHIRKMRQSNHFHYSWPVPYLPFSQQEVNIFEPTIGKINP